MKKTFYAYKNDKMGYFLNPFTAPYSQDEMKEVVKRSIKEAKPEDHVEELSLYEMFVMDDKTGKIEKAPNMPEFICSLSEFMDYGKDRENKND